MFEGRKKFPKRALGTALSHLNVKLLSQELADLPAHGGSHLLKVGRLVGPGVGGDRDELLAGLKALECHAVPKDTMLGHLARQGCCASRNVPKSIPISLQDRTVSAA